MPEANQQKIEQPTVPTGPQPRVFAMPERYRHDAEAKMHEPTVKAPVTAPMEVKTPTVPAPKAPPKLVPPKQKGSATKKILIVGVVVLLLLSVGGYFLLRTTQEEVPTETKTPSRPAPTTELEEEPEPEPEEEVQPEEEVFPTQVTPGTDSDSDGLTDTEENLVYDTDPKRPDTDSDGFLDGNEVFHGYNPGGTAPGTLIESGLVELATGSSNGTSYEYHYPSAWELEEIEGEMVLDAQTGEGFRISFETKQASQTLEAWVEETLALEEMSVRVTKNGLSSVVSEDQLSAYLDLGTVVLVLEYDTGIKARVDYLQTFQMMLNSVTYDSSTTESVDSQGGAEATADETSESP